jgi:hypothetical protein
VGLSAILLTLLGWLILAVATLDLLITTLLPSWGGGPITGRLNRWVWWGLLKLRSHELLRWGGLALLLLSFTIWMLSFLAGWTLVFAAVPDALVTNTDHPEPAPLHSRLYYVAFTISSLGIGDVVPNGWWWELLTGLTVFHGFGAITLGLSFIIAVVDAAVTQRALASHITALGDGPVQLLVNTAVGDDPPLGEHLPTLTQSLVQIAQAHKAYPVLHYFHNPDPQASAAVSIASLHEALVLLHAAVVNPAIPRTQLEVTMRAVGRLLDMMNFSAAPADGTPPRPDLQPLRDVGLELRTDEQIDEAMEAFADDRERIMRLVHHDGWDWHDVIEPDRD